MGMEYWRIQKLDCDNIGCRLVAIIILIFHMIRMGRRIARKDKNAGTISEVPIRLLPN